MKCAPQLSRAHMFDIQNYGSFVVAIIVFQVIPGPGTIAILNATGRNGVAAGFGAVLGTLLGDFLFMTAAILGLAAVMRANPILFETLQWFGAAYLCWIGITLLRAKIGGVETRDATKSPGIYLRQSFAVSLTNPKVILFFVAFFPLFMRPHASGATLVAMMAHVTLLSLIYQAGLVLLGNGIAQKLRTLPSARKIATRLAGVALIGFGVKLAISNR